MADVINLDERRRKAQKKTQPAAEQTSQELEDVMRKNAENDKRVKGERAKANKGVIRSHNLNK